MTDLSRLFALSGIIRVESLHNMLTPDIFNNRTVSCKDPLFLRLFLLMSSQKGLSLGQKCAIGTAGVT